MINNLRPDVSPHEPNGRPPLDPRLTVWTIVTILGAIMLGVIILSLAGCAASDDTPVDSGTTSDAGADVATDTTTDDGATSTTDSVPEVSPDGHSKSDALTDDRGADVGGVDALSMGAETACPTFGNCQLELCAPRTFTATPCPADRAFALCWFDEGIPNGSRLQQSGCNPSAGVTCVQSCQGGAS